MQHLFRDRFLDAQATKGDATALSAIQTLSVAPIANHSSFWTRISHVQHSSATPAAQQARKQSPPATAGLWLGAGMPISGRGYHRLIPFAFVPANVPGLVIPYQDHPF